MSSDTPAFIEWFRAAAPYIHSHRGKTVVLHLGGELITSPVFAHLVHDIALLNSLGIRLVMVFGARPQIEKLLQEKKLQQRIINGLRLTDAATIEIVRQAVGALRIQIEALLSMGLPNSPMAQAHIKVSSGNFVTARPIGVIDGVDLEFTGTVRRIDSSLINTNLDNQEIVLISPVGYSPTGEVFNLSSIEIATRVATGIQADKLIFLMAGENYRDSNGDMLEHLSPQQAEELLDGQDCNDGSHFAPLAAGLEASRKGIQRVHFIDQLQDGSLMQELFSRDGVGTLLTVLPFDDLRVATIDDIGGILELIRPLEEEGVLVRRSREKLEMEITDYTVLIRDGTVIGCAALHIYDDVAAELACVVVHENYRKLARGKELFLKAESDARQKGVKKLFALTTQATHWFLEQGFNESSVDDLPVSRRELYNFQRNSKVLIKNL